MAARAEIRAGNEIAKVLDDRGLESKDVGKLKTKLDELIRRGALFDEDGNLIVDEAAAAAAAAEEAARASAERAASAGRAWQILIATSYHAI